MATWYQVTSSCIRPVEVVRHTEKSVWITITGWHEDLEARRHARIGAWESYFPTWEEARTAAEQTLDVGVAESVRRLQSAHARREKFRHQMQELSLPLIGKVSY